MTGELSPAMHSALTHLAILESLGENFVTGVHPRAGWNQTASRTIAALERRGYVEPCNAYVPICFFDDRAPSLYRAAATRIWFQLTAKGRDYAALSRDIQAVLKGAP